MSSSPLETLVGLLADARREGRQIDNFPANLLPPTSAEAYRVNGMVAERLGWEPLGWKIAGTTAVVRRKLGLDEPIYGRTFRCFACPSPARFRAADLLAR